MMWKWGAFKVDKREEEFWDRIVLEMWMNT
jgi:hypothetical protein